MTARMEFNDNKPIYRQIIDFAYSQIMSGAWLPRERIPSVRELSMEMQVNSRTVLKAMENLQNSGIIEARRGLGFILSADADEKVAGERRKEFFSVTLPQFAEEMKLLGIVKADIEGYLP